MIGVDKAVFGCDDARLRVVKFADVRIENLYVKSSDEVVAHAGLDRVRFGLTQHAVYDRYDTIVCI